MPRLCRFLERLVTSAALIAAFSSPSGCSKKAPPEPPVATPGLTANRMRAALGSPMEITYKFDVAPNAPSFEQNYRVLVHFMDANEELMWTDDHDPTVPTKQWKPGQHVEYTRTVFIPIYPYIGEASVQMGLYSPKTEKRLTLAGDDRGQRSYKVATLQILPQSENVFLIYKDGWHAAEVSAESAAVEWQWTKKEATIAFRNPKRDSLFYLHLDGRPDLFKEPPHVTLLIGDQTVDTFALTSRDEVIRKIPISPVQLGSGDMVEMKIAVDKSFVPALTPGANSADSRELGVRVFHAFIEPR